jgi:hypothetical protein
VRRSSTQGRILPVSSMLRAAAAVLASLRQRAA